MNRRTISIILLILLATLAITANTQGTQLHQTVYDALAPEFTEDIKAIAATHQGNDIFNEIKTQGDQTTNAISTEETIKVTFEKKLQDGNTIDIYADSKDTFAYIEIYAGKRHVANTGLFEKGEREQHVTIKGLKWPTDTFTFKVKKYMFETYEDCEEETGACTQVMEPINKQRNARPAELYIDYITDAPIRHATADGLAIYTADSTGNQITHRIWNATSKQFSTATTEATALAGNGESLRLAANHERDEFIAASATSGTTRVETRVFQNGEWGNFQDHTPNNAVNPTQRPFDVAYEQLSGNALIVYENSSSADQILGYTIWNGTGYSTAGTLTTNLAAASDAMWIDLTPKHQSNDIMVTIIANNLDFTAVLWNGTDFVNDSHFSTVTNLETDLGETVDFEWEGIQGDGLFVIGETTGIDWVYHTFNATNNTWSNEQTFYTLNNGNPRQVRLCSDPTTDFIGFIQQDSANDVAVRMWNGSAIDDGFPAEEPSTESQADTKRNIDCLWNPNATYATFTYVDRNSDEIEYFNFSKLNTWSVGTIAGATTTITEVASDLHVVEGDFSPISNETVYLNLHADNSLRTIYDNLSNGTWWLQDAANQPLTSATECAAGASPCMDFKFNKYDPTPNVTNIFPESSYSVAFSDEIHINTTVTDNLNVDSVFANITYPNASQFEIRLNNSDGSSTYNGTFIVPSNITGTFNITIRANDTSLYENTNSTEIVNFTVAATEAPAVTPLSPLGLTYNISNNVNITAIVTDPVISVGTVYANITYPNGSVANLTELYVIENSHYNNTFAAPGVVGQFNITFITNNSDNVRNDTEVANFTVADVIAPSITIQNPATNNTEFNQTDDINITIQFTDDGAKHDALVNITRPDDVEEIFYLNDTENDNIYNFTFTNDTQTGLYEIRIQANDSENNLNDTEVINFNITDVREPLVEILDPTALETFSQATNVTIQVNVTDLFEDNVDVVLANVTLPNALFNTTTLRDNDGDQIFEANFTNSTDTGTYNITIWANDTFGNTNTTETRQFIIIDAGTPIIELVLPANNHVNATADIDFFCNATDTGELANITLFHNITTTFEANITTNVSGSVNETNFTISDIPDGTYLWNCLSADTAANQDFASQNRTISIDTTVPLVNVTSPVTPDSSNNVDANIVLEANVTEIRTDTVFANVTLPNATVQHVALTLQTGTTIYNTTFTLTDSLGTYNITIVANDTVDNTNSTQTTNFTIADTNSLAFSLPSCTPNDANLSATINCNITATDDIAIDTVTANVTLPNTTVLEQTVNNFSANNFSFTITETNVIGQYNITWFTNDTSGNEVMNQSESFNVSDSTLPVITLNQPADYFNTSGNTVEFNFTVDDNYAIDPSSCNLTIDSVLAGTNTTTLNGTLTSITNSSLTDGEHLWNVTCLDAGANQNTSTTLNFITDNGIPEFNSITTIPNEEADLDPNVEITVRANVTENLTTLDTVILQYRLNTSSSDFTNLTMNDIGNSIWNQSFNATDSGGYDIRIFANDSVNNAGFSNNITINVTTETTWTVPTSLGTVAVSGGTNASFTPFALNNTGDVTLNFNMSSDDVNASFNFSFPIDITAGNFELVNLTVTAPTIDGIYTINVTTNTTSNAIPTQINSTATLVVTEDAFLEATLVDPPTTLTQGDTSVTLTFQVENIGQANATNVTYNITVPSNWTLNAGEETIDIGEDTLLEPQETHSSIVIYNIPSDADTGPQNVTVNATGVNESGSNLETLGNILGTVYSITVNSPASSSGGAPTSSGGPAGPSSSTSSTAGSSGTGSTRELLTRSIFDRTTLETLEEIEVVRGETASFPLTVTNVYGTEASTLTKVDIQIESDFIQHITWDPKQLVNIKHGQSKDAKITIDSPAYQDSNTIEMTVIIVGLLEATEEIINEAGERTFRTHQTEIIEHRKIKVYLVWPSRETTLQDIKMSKQDSNNSKKRTFQQIK